MIPLYHILIVIFIIFSISFTGIIIRNNMLYILICTEIMLNSSALLCVIAGNYWKQTEGEIMYILSISIASIESCIGLILLIKLYYLKYSINVDSMSELNG
ncbi:NADH-quinone oxidoreductase subunit NuoK [Enterobacteriaceae endosymbiont of Neohaemonia nigricornis]|uniref:NADH-quinone oxidoreductase subunit NuoK n=1 Tax=Enterobacteriaceae endosymbiont of Neohaemonia nigricornis TaxID=2675792 RepID=UPI00144906D9|nr:NADH-quinone oxidoreductase subunit NuoK [Enterobacteriaceae endosymbiont of Neohaemonia nigricornis]QJC30545.1 NADH-quinone oxidoreductase subunit NuoK [Enterobacteriaceae endosymbiont of Neohaemonia nigricornis]